MKAVIQRVTRASVTVDGKIISQISKGLLILLGVEKDDKELDAQVLSSKISGMRIFCDSNDKMNLSLNDVNGGILVVSNFTLCADCSHGRRPYFGTAAKPEDADMLYKYFCNCLRNDGVSDVQQGIFGADMKVELLNDGPVTIILNSKELGKH